MNMSELTDTIIVRARMLIRMVRKSTVMSAMPLAGGKLRTRPKGKRAIRIVEGFFIFIFYGSDWSSLMLRLRGLTTMAIPWTW